MSDDRLAGLAERLDEISEEIADLAIDAIRGAMRRGQSGRPQDEKTLTQARRAVEKASHLLRNLDRASDGGADEDADD